MYNFNRLKVALKPCPFCGGKAEAVNYITEGAVRCTICWVRVSRAHNSPTIDDGYPAAISAWNTRAIIQDD